MSELLGDAERTFALNLNNENNENNEETEAANERSEA